MALIPPVSPLSVPVSNNPNQMPPTSDGSGQQTPPGSGGSGGISNLNIPGPIKWLAALLVVGGLSEFLYDNVSHTAGYLLVGLVLFAYAVEPKHFAGISDLLTALGLGA